MLAFSRCERLKRALFTSGLLPIKYRESLKIRIENEKNKITPVVGTLK